MKKLAPQVKQNLQSGCRTCGIVPLDRQQVIKKLPGSNDEASANVSAAVLDMLDTLRYGEKEKIVPRVRCKVAVEPGKSVGTCDYHDSAASTSAAPTEATGSSTRSRQKVS